MSETFEVSPFVASVESDAVVFRFDRNSFAHGFEYPPNLEGLLAGVVADRPERFASRRIVIDLEDLPAISSKQLGAMLAIRQICAADPSGSGSKILVRNLRPNVRELLQITKLGDFFEWD